MAFVPHSSLAQAKGRAGRSQSYLGSPGMNLGKVIKIDRGNHTVDLVMYTGENLIGVKVASSALGTRTGRSYIPKFSNPVQSSVPQLNQGTFIDDKDRTIYALVEYMLDDLISPVVVGFVFPKTTQMHFNREGFSVDRHETDQYSFTETNLQSPYDPVTDTYLSTTEWVHPSGFWLRIGQGNTHEDLTGQDAQGLWKVRGTNNANSPIGTPGPDVLDYTPVTLHHPSGSAVVFDTQGNVDITVPAGGLVRVNGFSVLREPVCDHLGQMLVDANGSPVMG